MFAKAGVIAGLEQIFIYEDRWYIKMITWAEKNRHIKILISAMVFLGIAVILLVTRMFIKSYGTEDVSRVYLSWGSYIDISGDLSCMAVNDSNEAVYYIDYDTQKVRYILNADDIPVDNAAFSYVCLDSENNLYITVIEKDEYNRGNYSERIIAYDENGNLLREYMISDEEMDNGYLRTYGLMADGGYLHFVQIYNDHYEIKQIKIAGGSTETLAVFSLEKNREVVNASYDKGSFCINYSDGTAVSAGTDGQEEEILSFNFHINDADYKNIYPDMLAHYSDGYYFIDKKYFDRIYRKGNDGELESVYTLGELYEWDEDLEEKEYREYHDNVVDYSFAMLSVHGDILFFVSNANIFIVHDGEMDAIYATDDGIELSAPYVMCNIYKKYSLYAGIGFAVLALLMCLYYIIRYHFTVLNKMVICLVPLIILAFSGIIRIVINQVETMYLDDVRSQLITASSLTASALDVDFIKELNDLEDVNNGNAGLIRERLKAVVEDRTDWSKDIEFSLYAMDDTMCNYILAVYPQEEFEYLNTYYLQTVEDLDEVRIGDSKISYAKTFDQEDVYMDAMTLIYDGDKPIAILDAYKFMEKMNDDIRKLKTTIMLIGVAFTFIILVVLVLVTRYITYNIGHTSRIIEKISGGDLDARVEKLPNDEIGIVGHGINHMATQLKELFAEQEEFSMQVIECLVGTIDAKDKYTNGHSLRVAQYSAAIAKILGKSEEEQHQIYYAGLLHDIGKIGVPDTIINKTSKLTDDEYGTIKTHPEIGYDILSKLSRLSVIAIGAFSHHERIDGRGYPQGLKGDAIPEIARIIGVADTYDAMTSNRSYRSKLPQDVVRSELENAKGTQLDAQFAQIMLDIDMDMYPEGY